MGEIITQKTPSIDFIDFLRQWNRKEIKSLEGYSLRTFHNYSENSHLAHTYLTSIGAVYTSDPSPIPLQGFNGEFPIEAYILLLDAENKDDLRDSKHQNLESVFKRFEEFINNAPSAEGIGTTYPHESGVHEMGVARYSHEKGILLMAKPIFSYDQLTVGLEFVCSKTD